MREATTRLALDHAALVPPIARSLKFRIGHRADVEDMRGDGYVGLCRAAISYEREQPAVAFEAWAVTFIRRAIVDGVRRSWGRHFRDLPASLDERVVTSDGSMTLLDTIEDQTDVVALVGLRETLVERVLTPRPLGSLSPAEIDVLARAAQGDTIKMTAAELGRSIETVKSQRRSILDKLSARDMTQAVYVAMRERIVS
jgi:DNA-binding CsgD family transcriptional regulator